MEVMKHNFFILSGLFCLLAAPALFAQDNTQKPTAESDEPGCQSAEAFAIIPNLEPEEVSDIDISRTKTVFKANVKSCDLYLNNNYYGKSTLTLNNLVDGFYLLRVEKQGYLPKENFIYAEHGKSKTFYIELQPTEETQKKLDAQAQSTPAPEAQKSSTNENTPAESTVATDSANASVGDAK